MACSLMLLPAVEALTGLVATGAGAGAGGGRLGEILDIESPLLAVRGLRGSSGEPRLDIVGRLRSLTDSLTVRVVVW